VTDRISAICAAIATIGATIPGINAHGVFDLPPANLNTGDLPAVFTWAGPGQHSPLGEMVDITARRFYVQVAVIPISQGDPNTRERLVRPLMEAALAAYRGHPRLTNLDWVRVALVGSDSGVIILPEYGGKFVGFEISLDVTYITPRTISTNE